MDGGWGKGAVVTLGWAFVFLGLGVGGFLRGDGGKVKLGVDRSGVVW